MYKQDLSSSARGRAAAAKRRWFRENPGLAGNFRDSNPGKSGKIRDYPGLSGTGRELRPGVVPPPGSALRADYSRGAGPRGDPSRGPGPSGLPCRAAGSPPGRSWCVEQAIQNWSGQGESDCLIKTKHCDGLKRC